MLLGVRERLRDEILAAGHPLRIYVPYGRSWYGYSLRRLRENPAIAGHVLRATFGAR
jgi:proline dehydrogenase